MQLFFDLSKAKAYHSKSQIARVLTELWVNDNLYCPRCGNKRISKYPNNLPVADFYCPHCQSEFELKSKNGALGRKVPDGAYGTMIERITSNENPDFLFMGYSSENQSVHSLLFIPNYFFVPEIIEKRKPLAETAKRAGWVGCNILLDQIPKQGRIEVISNGILREMDEVVSKVRQSLALKTTNIAERGWLFDILKCLNQIPTERFSLQDMYAFENVLQKKYPWNHNIRPKIRQQLQVLRDRGLISFLGNGQYQKVNYRE